jgi:hypothetical protein
MTEYTMKNGLLVPGSSRRSFMQVMAAAFTGAVVAPVIVPYSSMMHIDTPDNKLVYAFTGGKGNGDDYIKSLLNLGECLDPFVRAQWESQNPHLTYDLVRVGRIPAQFEHRYGQVWFTDFHTKGLDTTYLQRTKNNFRQRVANFREHKTFDI